MLKYALPLSFALLLPGMVSAQTPAEVETWLRETSARAEQFELPEDTLITWETEGLTLPASTIQKWRVEVQGSPVHPLRPYLETQERRVAKGPDKGGSRFYYAHPGLWRRVLDVPWMEGMGFLDAGLDDEVVWGLNQGSLSLYEKTPLFGEPDFASQTLALVLSTLRLFVGQGLANTGLTESSTKCLVQVNNEGWQSSWTTESGWMYQAAGKWNASSRVGAVRSLVVTEPSGQASRWLQVSDIEANDRLGWVAHSVETTSEHDRSISRLLGVDSVPREEVRELARPPVPDKSSPEGTITDSVRGLLVISGIQDLRSKSRTVATKSGVDWERTPVPVPQTSDGWRSSMTGWVAIGVIVTALVFLRWKARRG